METAIATENHTKSAANRSLALGVLILLLGTVALFVPTLTAFAANFTLAWIALAIGVLQLIVAAYVGISMISGGVWRIVMSFAIRNAAVAQASR